MVTVELPLQLSANVSGPRDVFAIQGVEFMSNVARKYWLAVALSGVRVLSYLCASARASRLRRSRSTSPMTPLSGGRRRLRSRAPWPGFLRMKQLDSRAWARSNKLAKSLGDSWSVIQPSDALRATSIQLVDRYDLRAADSFQLAAALEWCEYAPQGRVFLSADQKLRDAALLSGFDAKQM